MDREAVYKLIEEYYRNNRKRLVNQYAGRTGGRTNSEDVVQEAFLRACQYWKSYRQDGNIDGWISRILNNSMKRFNKAERNRGMVTEFRDGDHAVNAASPYLARLVSEIKEDIRNKGEWGDKGEIVRLYFLDQYKPSEIVEIVDVTYNTICNTINLYKKELRAKYGDSVHC